jgi:hypothetical protein
MPAGRAVHASNAHVASYDFQVCQRKNPGWTEPFTTWLLFAKKVAKWMACLLECEDTYRPLLPPEKEASVNAVLQGSTRLGLFNDSRQMFTRLPDGTAF